MHINQGPTLLKFESNSLQECLCEEWLKQAGLMPGENAWLETPKRVKGAESDQFTFVLNTSSESHKEFWMAFAHFQHLPCLHFSLHSFTGADSEVVEEFWSLRLERLFASEFEVISCALIELEQLRKIPSWSEIFLGLLSVPFASLPSSRVKGASWAVNLKLLLESNQIIPHPESSQDIVQAAKREWTNLPMDMVLTPLQKNEVVAKLKANLNDSLLRDLLKK